MRGLERIPGRTDLETAYSVLHPAAVQLVSERDLALYSQWARLDPRLAEIWVASLSRDWRRLNPIALREALLTQPWPSAVGPLLEFCAHLVLPRVERKLFVQWSKLVLSGIARASGEQFFIGQRAIGGKQMRLDAELSLSEYRKWGYLSRDVPVNKAPARLERRDPETRRQILLALLTQSSRITARRYHEAVGRGISRRQAERDLASCPELRAQGNTKGRVYVVRRHPTKL